MSTYLTVRQFGQVAPEHRATLASLQADLRLIETGTPDIALVGSDPEAVREALALAPRAVVVADPAAISDADAARLNSASPLVLPVLNLAASLRRVKGGDILAGAGLVHSRFNWWGGMRESLFEHLTGLTAVVGNLAELALVSQSDRSYVGSAKTSNGVEVNWSGLAAAPSSRYELDIVGLAERMEVRADLDGSARPLAVRRALVGGLHQPLSIYETGLRLFWRDTVAILTNGVNGVEWKHIAALHKLASQLVLTANSNAT